jgi:elongation factor G
MTEYSSDQLRNIALVGHGAAGKTSLASAVLYHTKMVTRLGKIEDGTTVTDYGEDEIQRGFSLGLAACFATVGRTKINILDTPGYGDFVADARPALQVAEAAVVVVCGVSGVEVFTERVWEWAEQSRLPRVVFVNKLDRERSSFERTLESLRENLDGKFVPVALPIGSEEGFEGVIDLLTMKARYYPDLSGNGKVQDIPAEHADWARRMRETLVENAAEMDDSLLERYLEGEEITDEQLIEGVQKGVTSGRLHIVLCGSATKNIGTDVLLDKIVDYCPPPTAGGEISGKGKDDAEVRRPRSSAAPASAYVFKTIADPYAGKITLFRVYSGTISGDSNIFNASTGQEERVGHLFYLQGKENVPTSRVSAGDIAAVAKLKNTSTGDTLCDASHPIRFQSLEPLPRLMSFAVEPKSRGDEEKISVSLRKLCEEDPTLEVKRDERTNELVLRGMGQLHLEVAIDRLKRKFGVEATLKQPKVPYLETLSGRADVRYRHKKQTGGAGQFGECAIRIEPNARGAGFEFVNGVVGGVIPSQYIPSVEKGVLSRMSDGVLAGYPVVDVRVEVYDGKYHPVDSKDIAFQIAGRMAFREGALKARPILLEPIMQMEVITPEEKAGDIMGNLNSRRGRVLGMEPHGKRKQLIRAEVPLAEVQRYAPDLQSITGGRGSYTLSFLRYEPVPAHLQEKIVAESKGSVAEE